MKRIIECAYQKMKLFAWKWYIHSKHKTRERWQGKSLCASTATKWATTNVSAYTGKRACVGIGRVGSARKRDFARLHTVKVIDGKCLRVYRSPPSSCYDRPVIDPPPAHTRCVVLFVVTFLQHMYKWGSSRSRDFWTSTQRPQLNRLTCDSCTARRYPLM